MANSTTDFNGTHSAHKMRATGRPPGALRAARQKTPAGKAHKKARPAGRAGKGSRGVRVERHFTVAGADPLDAVVYERRSSTITNPDGSIVFKMEGAEVPAGWSQLATDILISKYFRKAGLHGDKDRARPASARSSTASRTPSAARASSSAATSPTKADADTFEAELSLPARATSTARSTRRCGSTAGSGTSTGSPARAATGRGTPRRRRTSPRRTNAYERPQCSACFIQAAKDDLMSHLRAVKSEARLFKYGSGTGSNFSAIRGKQEKLSGGGTSSGLMSFLEVFDRAAGATKSGGTTRRAAKMVCLDMDHPEIADFINWKVREEKKAHALIAGRLLAPTSTARPTTRSAGRTRTTASA